MATPSSEAASAAATYHVALAMLGSKSYAETYLTFEKLGKAATTQVAFGRWMRRAIAASMGKHSAAIELAIPFMRLQRALMTGYTFQYPGYSTRPSMDSLRKEFLDAVKKHAPLALETNKIEDPIPDDGIDDSREIERPDGGGYEPYRPGSSDEEAVEEEIERLEREIEKQRREAQKQLEELFITHGAKRAKSDEKERARTRDKRSAQEELARVKRDRQRQARILAGHSERVVQNGGRATESIAVVLDKRALGWVRVHYPEGDIRPCGFCALLMSRGFVYKTEESAFFKSASLAENALDQYHNGCHCRAEAIYEKSDYKSDPRFAPNREYRKLWNSKFQGKRDAISKWRKHFRDQKSARSRKTK